MKKGVKVKVRIRNNKFKVHGSRYGQGTALLAHSSLSFHLLLQLLHSRLQLETSSVLTLCLAFLSFQGCLRLLQLVVKSLLVPSQLRREGGKTSSATAIARCPRLVKLQISKVEDEEVPKQGK